MGYYMMHINHIKGEIRERKYKSVGRERKGQTGDRTRDYPIHAGRSATELPSRLLEESSTPTKSKSQGHSDPCSCCCHTYQYVGKVLVSMLET